MTGDIVINAEGLGKKYTIGHETERERYVALRDVLSRKVRNAWRKTLDMVQGRPVVAGDTVEEFWALKDVSFELERGEVLGIIGRNGSGKSTLLKILSRITEPSEGRVTIRGRVASLLEVGTGFHPELTGRENIYLNGAILGMTRAEISRRFDEIVAFAEVKKFLDTPVKRYSSGMYVRLAFAVAAHLEPDILVVDEVLAVGDAEFQKKCLGKISEVAGHGRTVLFVSHNMRTIRTLCKKAILLENGNIKASGPSIDITDEYISENRISTRPLQRQRHSDKPAIVGISWTKSSSDTTEKNDPSLDIEMIISSPSSLTTNIDLRLKDGYNNPVGFGSLGTFQSTRPVSLNPGLNTVIVSLPTSQLALGEYIVSLDLTHPFVEFFDRLEDCIRFQLSGNSLAASLRSLEQNWGYGCTVLPLAIKKMEIGANKSTLASGINFIKVRNTEQAPSGEISGD